MEGLVYGFYTENYEDFCKSLVMNDSYESKNTNSELMKNRKEIIEILSEEELNSVVSAVNSEYIN